MSHSDLTRLFVVVGDAAFLLAVIALIVGLATGSEPEPLMPLSVTAGLAWTAGVMHWLRTDWLPRRVRNKQEADRG